MNLKEIAYAHYLPAKRKRRRANTCEGYASALRLHVIPRFGAMEMEAITHEAIQEWVDGSDPHLWLIKDTNLGDESEMRFVFTWVR